MVALNGKLYFLAQNGTHRQQLWQSNGTASGTMLVKDINPTATSVLKGLCAVNQTLYFVVGANTRYSELWKSDGTADGTVKVKGAGSGMDWFGIDPTHV